MFSKKLVVRDIPGLEAKLKNASDKNSVNNISLEFYGDRAKGTSERRDISSFS